jgi:hypothetical protein
MFDHPLRTAHERTDARIPPSTSRIEPLQNDESGERKNATAPATSSPVPILPAGGTSQPDVSPKARPDLRHHRARCRLGRRRSP